MYTGVYVWRGARGTREGGSESATAVGALLKEQLGFYLEAVWCEADPARASGAAMGPAAATLVGPAREAQVVSIPWDLLPGWIGWTALQRSRCS